MNVSTCRRFGFAFAAVAAALAASVLLDAAPFTGVSLAVSRETAPPDGFAQLKVFVTESKPISTGSADFAFAAYDAFVGLAIMSPAQDTYGIALVRGTNIAVSVVSTTSSFGTWLDYPLLTIVGHVPATAPLGVKFPLAIDPSALQLWDPFGLLYPVEVRQGHLVTGLGVAISDVSPGSAILATGGTVTIRGTNFTPQTVIKFREAKLSEIRYIDSTRIDVVLAQAVRMHGVLVKASNPDGSQATYYSYQRTRSVAPSADPLLRDAVPLLPPRETTMALVTLPNAPPTTSFGVAVQNVQFGEAVVAVDLVDPTGVVLDTKTLRLPSSRFVVRELGELFGFAPSAGWAVRVRSSLPVQVVGMTADYPNGVVAPIVAR